MSSASLVLKILLLGLLAFGPLAAGAGPADADACWATYDIDPPTDPIGDDIDAPARIERMSLLFDAQPGLTATTAAVARATLRHARWPHAPPF